MYYRNKDLDDSLIHNVMGRMRLDQEFIVSFLQDAFDLSTRDAVHLEFLLHLDLGAECEMTDYEDWYDDGR